jgi:hypothetical protein
MYMIVSRDVRKGQRGSMERERERWGSLLGEDPVLLIRLDRLVDLRKRSNKKKNQNHDDNDDIHIGVNLFYLSDNKCQPN